MGQRNQSTERGAVPLITGASREGPFPFPPLPPFISGHAVISSLGTRE